MRTLTTIVGLLICTTALAGFRSAEFGMSRAQVKATEPDAMWLDLNETTLVMDGEVADLDATILFKFVGDQFARGAYVFWREYSNRNRYLIEFDRVAELLEGTYGKPRQDKTVWVDDAFKRKRGDWGLAVAVGDLVKYKGWRTKSTDIQISLYGRDMDIVFNLTYESRKLASALEKQEDRKASKGL